MQRTKEGVKSSGSLSQCFGEKDIKDEGRWREGNMDGRQQQQRGRDSRETLDKMKNGMENG